MKISLAVVFSFLSLVVCVPLIGKLFFLTFSPIDKAVLMVWVLRVYCAVCLFTVGYYFIDSLLK